MAINWGFSWGIHVFDCFWTKPCCITSGLLTMKPLPRLTCPSCGLKGRNLGHDLVNGLPHRLFVYHHFSHWNGHSNGHKLEYPPFFDQHRTKNEESWWSGTQTALTSCSFSSVSAEAPVEAGTDRLDAHNTLVLGHRVDLQNLISIEFNISLWTK